MRKWENSKADRAADKKAAQKAGMSAKKFEGSKVDEKMDRAGQKKLNKKR